MAALLYSRADFLSREKAARRKNMGRRIAVLFAAISLLACCARAARIASDRIALVDMEMVYGSYAGTAESRKMMSEEIRIKKEEIMALQAKIDRLETGAAEPAAEPGGETDIFLGTDTLKNDNRSVPDASGTESLKNELREKISELEAGLNNVDELVKYRIVGRIYDAIKEIALSEGYSIVIDKEDMIYCETENVDITDRVIRKLNENR